MAEPLKSGVPWIMHALRFCDVLEDSDPTKLSWTKIGVMLSTVFAGITGAATTAQAVVGHLAATDWRAFAIAIGFHTVTKGAHEIKRRTEARG